MRSDADVLCLKISKKSLLREILKAFVENRIQYL
jgi:hypothetical protein